MVAVCCSYLFACGKTSDIQLSQNNLSLQAIWLEVNWSMTGPIFQCHADKISFVVIFDINVIVLVSLLSRMFAFMLHSEYTTGCFMAESVVWHNFKSSSKKQARRFIVFFWTVILFNCLNVNMFFLFVCLWDYKYLLSPCVSETLAGDFLSAHLIYRGKVGLCHPL